MTPRWLERARQLQPEDRRLLARSVALLWSARLLVAVRPLQQARRWLFRIARGGQNPPTQERIAWAVQAGRRLAPGTTCLPLALTGEALLARAGHEPELRIGVMKKPQGALEAHAWVEVDGRVVVGELHTGLDEFTRLPPLPGPDRAP